MSALTQTLLAHRARHPSMEAEDAVKMVFQAMMGVGHLLPDPAAAEAFLLREWAGLSPDASEPLTEPLGPRWLRLNLRPAMAAGLRPAWIARMMCLSPGPGHTREEVYAECLSACPEAGWPRERVLAAAAPLLSDPAWLPGHSPAYRAAEQPAYRVLDAGWAPLLPALAAVGAAENAPRLLLTLDGRCASGKTTAAACLAAVLQAPVVHSDDYVVPHAAKAPERLAIPGGNCDLERLTEEVLTPWAEGRPLLLRRYDCRRDALTGPVSLPWPRLLLLEGCYTGLPPIAALADVRLFADISPAAQRERILRRNGPEALESYLRRWIPLEEAYFSAYQLPGDRCLRLDGQALCLDRIAPRQGG